MCSNHDLCFFLNSIVFPLPFRCFFSFYPCFLWVSSLAYPNLLGTKGYVVVVVTFHIIKLKFIINHLDGQFTISGHRHPQKFTPPNQPTKGFLKVLLGLNPASEYGNVGHQGVNSLSGLPLIIGVGQLIV
jgi:hypothetical protein